MRLFRSFEKSHKPTKTSPTPKRERSMIHTASMDPNQPPSVTLTSHKPTISSQSSFLPTISTMTRTISSAVSSAVGKASRGAVLGIWGGLEAFLLSLVITMISSREAFQAHPSQAAALEEERPNQSAPQPRQCNSFLTKKWQDSDNQEDHYHQTRRH